jgi:hypothetical protein
MTENETTASPRLADSKWNQQVPQSVIAVRNIDDNNKVWSYGVGTYVGDHPRPGSEEPLSEETIAYYTEIIRDMDENPPLDITSWLAKRVESGEITQEEADEQIQYAADRRAEDLATPMIERVERLHRQVSKNPKIELDHGGVVWGYQCWWGPEAEMRDRVYKGRIIEFIDPPGESDSSED